MVTTRRQEGSALVLALAAASLVAAAVMLLAVMVDGRQSAAAYDRRGVVLSELADGAVAQTLAELAVQPSFAGVPERPFGDGSIQSSVTVTPTGLTVVTGVGAAAGWRCVVVAEVVMEGGPRVVRMHRRYLPPRPNAVDPDLPGGGRGSGGWLPRPGSRQ